MMRSRWLTGVLIIALAGLAVIAGSRLLVDDSVAVVEPGLGLDSVLRSEPLPGLRKASSDYEIRFPEDHGPHNDYASEWWYVTGNVQGLEGDGYGYQLTLFRNTVAANVPPLKSDFATNQYYMAHFALTDAAGQKFYSEERFARGAAGLAGARAQPFKVWLENWRLTGERSDACDGCMVINLSAATDEFEINLDLKPVRPLVLQGDDGFSAKTVDGEHASHYYSMTRLASTGFVRIGDKRTEVSGTSWFDREWSTAALGDDQIGWDWFSLHLDDGRDVMVYRMRKSDGSQDPASAGIVVSESGQMESFDAESFTLTPVKSWTSPGSGVVYPLTWNIELPDQALTLTVTPVVERQEHLGIFQYWEGAVRVTGKRGDDAVGGVGYMELTGYVRP